MSFTAHEVKDGRYGWVLTGEGIIGCGVYEADCRDYKGSVTLLKTEHRKSDRTAHEKGPDYDEDW